jgi:hypothetical protein
MLHSPTEEPPLSGIRDTSPAALAASFKGPSGPGTGAFSFRESMAAEGGESAFGGAWCQKEKIVFGKSSHAFRVTAES